MLLRLRHLNFRAPIHHANVGPALPAVFLSALVGHAALIRSAIDLVAAGSVMLAQNRDVQSDVPKRSSTAFAFFVRNYLGAA